jgi:hypothetical protein
MFHNEERVFHKRAKNRVSENKFTRFSTGFFTRNLKNEATYRKLKSLFHNFGKKDSQGVGLWKTLFMNCDLSN